MVSAPDAESSSDDEHLLQIGRRDTRSPQLGTPDDLPP